MARREKLIIRTYAITAKKPGHWERDCPKKVKNYYIAALVQNDSLSKRDLVMVIGEQLQHFEQWVLDLGCFYHMCLHKNWLVTYEEKFGGNVLMGNNTPRKYVGIGSVQINMHDGVVKTLTKVCHVPKLKKNLVSVGAIDLIGFSCWVKGGVIHIRGKWKYVVMQGTKQINFYMLQGSTTAGSVSTISQSGSHASNNSLWHLRLGHMCEKGLDILSKQGLLANHKVKPFQFCEHRIYGKKHQTKFPKDEHAINDMLDYDHFDCWGPSRVP